LEGLWLWPLSVAKYSIEFRIKNLASLCYAVTAGLNYSWGRS